MRTICEYRVSCILVITVGVLSQIAVASPPCQIDWVRQIGTTEHDRFFGVTGDNMGNIYVTGNTGGSLAGASSGWYDAILCKYDGYGNFHWSRQFGTAGDDDGHAVTTDSLGNVFVGGDTYGDLAGYNQGKYDEFVGKYSNAGDLQWMGQYGTSGSETSYALWEDNSGNVFSAGRVNNGNYLLGRYTDSGTRDWAAPIVTNTIAYGMTGDSQGNLYVAGITKQSLYGANAGGYDAFVRKYDDGSVLQWTRQLGADSNDFAEGVTVDAQGNVYITGYNYGALEGTSPDPDRTDIFVSKYDASGNLQWVNQVGSAGDDHNYAVWVDSQSNVYTAGSTNGDWGEGSGVNRALVCKFNLNGELLWSYLPALYQPIVRGAWFDQAGHLYLSGSTVSSLDGQNAGGEDAFVARLTIPEPAAMSLMALGGLALIRRQKV